MKMLECQMEEINSNRMGLIGGKGGQQVGVLVIQWVKG